MTRAAWIAEALWLADQYADAVKERNLEPTTLNKKAADDARIDLLAHLQTEQPRE